MKAITVTILLVFLAGRNHAEDAVNWKEETRFVISSLAEKWQVKKKKTSGFRTILGQTSEIKGIFMGIIVLYQEVISSQDQNSCNFSLSCSRFSQNAISSYGIFYGLLMTADRLQRCHDFAKKTYPLDPDSQNAIDYPLSNYYLGKANGTSK